MGTDSSGATSLSSVEGFAFEVRTTPGSETRARHLAARVERVLDWLERVTGRSPTATVYVVGPQDWDLVAEFPIYGMPQAVPGKVVVPLTPAPWLNEYVASISARVPEASRHELGRVFAEPTALADFIDLVLVHELTHLTEDFEPPMWEGEFPAVWLSELYANIGMYGYLSDEEPHTLPLLMALAEATREAGHALRPVKHLDQMGESLAHGPGHYVWFQMLQVLVAQQFWRTGGAQTMRDFKLRLSDRALSPEQALQVIAEIDPPTASTLRRWPDV